MVRIESRSLHPPQDMQDVMCPQAFNRFPCISVKCIFAFKSILVLFFRVFFIVFFFFSIQFIREMCFTIDVFLFQCVLMLSVIVIHISQHFQNQIDKRKLDIVTAFFFSSAFCDI